MILKLIIYVNIPMCKHTSVNNYSKMKNNPVTGQTEDHTFNHNHMPDHKDALWLQNKLHQIQSTEYCSVQKIQSKQETDQTEEGCFM